MHWDRDSRQSSTLVWPTTNGYKHHFRLKVADGGWEALACWQLLPISLQQQPRFPFKAPFWQTHASQPQIQQSVRLLSPGRPYPEQNRKLFPERVGQYCYITNLRGSPGSMQQQYRQGKTKSCGAAHAAKCHTNSFFRFPTVGWSHQSGGWTSSGIQHVSHHTCVCGTQVDARGLHGLTYKKSQPRHICHAMVNDIMWRAIKNSQVPASKEPVGLSREDCQTSRFRNFVTLGSWKTDGLGRNWTRYVPTIPPWQNLSKAGAAADNTAIV